MSHIFQNSLIAVESQENTHLNDSLSQGFLTLARSISLKINYLARNSVQS
jgi:hypothetical protein